MEIEKLLQQEAVIARIPASILPLLALVPEDTDNIPGLFENVHNYGDPAAELGALWNIVEGFKKAVDPERTNSGDYYGSFASDVVNHALYLLDLSPERKIEIDNRVESWMTTLKKHCQKFYKDQGYETSIDQQHFRWREVINYAWIPELR